MQRFRFWVALQCVTLSLLASACTPGSFASGSTPSAAAPGGTHVVAVDVDLTLDPSGTTAAGTAGGYSPLTLALVVGDAVRFTNSDGFAHTVTSISGSTFPAAYPFTSAALTQSGATLSSGFSSGSLAAGASSQTLLADRAGTYLFGCFYHYGSPMRAEIDVR